MFYGGVGVALLSVWTIFTLHAFNQERLASSVVRQIMDILQCSNDDHLIGNVGRRINMVPSWFWFNQPHIAGRVRPKIVIYPFLYSTESDTRLTFYKGKLM